MELNEKQLEMCTASRWDFSDLRAIFLGSIRVSRRYFGALRAFSWVI